MYPFCSNANFYGGELLAPYPAPKLEDHPLSALWDCLFNIFAPIHTGILNSIRHLMTRHAVVTDPHHFICILLAEYLVFKSPRVYSFAASTAYNVTSYIHLRSQQYRSHVSCLFERNTCEKFVFDIKCA
jgi:hypothetical protein